MNKIPFQQEYLGCEFCKEQKPHLNKAGEYCIKETPLKRYINEEMPAEVYMNIYLCPYCNNIFNLFKHKSIYQLDFTE